MITSSVRTFSGRDVANAQIENGHLFIDFADTPNGADNYSIQVSFTPKPPPVVSPSATLHISANVDGSDVLHITNSSATWSHGFWGDPTNVTLNGTPWDTVNNPTLPNSGSTSPCRRALICRPYGFRKMPAATPPPISFFRITSTCTSRTLRSGPAITT